MKVRALWITLTAVAALAVFAPASASAESSPQQPDFTITGTTNSTVSIEWIDRSTNEAGFVVEMRSSITDWKEVLDLRDHRAGQPQATGWTYHNTFDVSPAHLVRGICFRVKAYNDSGSSDWTRYLCTLPDLVLVAVSVPGLIGPGQAFTIGFSACNLGIVTTGRYSIQYGVQGRETHSFPMPALSADSCYFQQVQMNFGLPAGLHHVSVALDTLGEVAEVFENNNVGTRLISVN